MAAFLRLPVCTRRNVRFFFSSCASSGRRNKKPTSSFRKLSAAYNIPDQYVDINLRIIGFISTRPALGPSIIISSSSPKLCIKILQELFHSIREFGHHVYML